MEWVFLNSVSCCHQNLQVFDEWPVLISLVCPVSLRPDGAEEHRQHLLHERRPPGPVQLVRSHPSPFACTSCLLRVTFRSLLILSTRFIPRPLASCWLWETTVAVLIWESDGWVKIAAVHHLRWQKWPFVDPCRVFCYKWTPTLSPPPASPLPLLLFSFPFPHPVFLCLSLYCFSPSLPHFLLFIELPIPLIHSLWLDCWCCHLNWGSAAERLCYYLLLTLYFLYSVAGKFLN